MKTHAAFPDVSFLMPARNAERWIEDAISSALAQIDVDVEVIVVDDASSDSTAERARHAGRGHNVVVLEGAGRGPAAARNVAIEAAHGRWLALLDADDLIEPVRSRDLIAAAETHGADLVADNIVRFSDDNAADRTTLVLSDRPACIEIGLIDWIDRNHMLGGPDNLGYLQPMFRADFVRRRNLAYDSHIMIGEDYLIVLDALIRGARFIVTNAPTYRYRFVEGSLSRRFDANAAERLQHAHDRMMSRVSPETYPGLSRSLARHRRSHEAAIAYEELKSDLRRGSWTMAARHVASRPALWRALPLLARRRLERSFRSSRV